MPLKFGTPSVIEAPRCDFMARREEKEGRSDQLVVPAILAGIDKPCKFTDRVVRPSRKYWSPSMREGKWKENLSMHAWFE